MIKLTSGDQYGQIIYVNPAAVAVIGFAMKNGKPGGTTIGLIGGAHIFVVEEPDVVQQKMIGK